MSIIFAILKVQSFIFYKTFHSAAAFIVAMLKKPPEGIKNKCSTWNILFLLPFYEQRLISSRIWYIIRGRNGIYKGL